MNRSKLFFMGLLVLIGCLLIVPLATAQYRGGIKGTVTDAQGAVVPGAKVTLTNLETNKTVTDVTNNGGIYNFGALPPSKFKLEVSKDGFKSKVFDNVTIIAEQVNALDVTLDVGAATESVTVNAEDAPLIDTETASVSGTITTKQLQSLPVFGRDVFQTVQLAPGFFGDGARDGGGNTNSMAGNQGPGGAGAQTGVYATENRPQVSGVGGRTDMNNVTLDGVSINSVSWNSAAIVTPNPDSVKEIKAASNDYDAEYGRMGAGQVQVITQNGTNQFHGSLFFKMDRPGLNAYQNWSGPEGHPTAPQQNTSRFNDWGGSIGGPIWKNKIFFFFAYDTIRNASTSTGTGWYETPALLNSAPANSLASRYGAFKGEAATSYLNVIDQTCASIGLNSSNCTMIPGQGLDIGSPLTTPLGTHDPTFQNNLNPGVGNGLDGVPDIFFVNAKGPNNQVNQQYMGRLDFNATKNDLIGFSMYWVPVSNTFVNGGLARPANLFYHNAINQAMTLIWNHTFTPTLLNEARVNAAGWRWNELTSNPQTPLGLPQTAFIGDQNNGNQIGSISTNGLGGGAGSYFDQWTYGYKDVVTKVVGAHTMKFGGDVTEYHFVQAAPWSARPNWGFNNYWDFLNDAPIKETGTFNPLTGVPTDVRKDSRATTWSFFGQDNWKFRPNLTLTMGLRWDYFGSLYFLHNQLSSVQLGQGADALTGMSMRIGGSLYTPPKTNFSPQLGFAWNPNQFLKWNTNGKLVIRGGFGIGFNGQEQAITLNGWQNIPFVAGYGNLTGSQIVYDFPSNPNQYAPYPANPYTVQAFDSNNIPVPCGEGSQHCSGAVGVTGFPSYYPTTYMYRYSLVGQYDLGRNWVATLGYQGTVGHHLTRQYNVNQMLGAQGIPLNPQVNNVDWYAQDGNSHYNAFLAELNHQFSSQFQFAAQYKYSSSIDNASGPYTVSYYQWNSAANYGPSDFNVGNMLKFYGVYQPKIFEGNNWKNTMFGGWTLTGIMNYHSGFPYTPYFNSTCNLIYSGGSCQNGSNSQLLPAAYLGGAASSHVNGTFLQTGGAFPKGPLAYFTAPDFTDCQATYPDTCPGAPQMPWLGRNAFTGPSYFDLDMTLQKNFKLSRIPKIGEQAALQIQMSAFNLFNNLNLSNINANIGSISYDGEGNKTVSPNTSFGQAFSALGARTAEVQFKFSF